MHKIKLQNKIAKQISYAEIQLSKDLFLKHICDKVISVLLYQGFT